MKIEWIHLEAKSSGSLAVVLAPTKQGGFMKAKRFTTLLVSSVLAASMLVDVAA